MILRYLFKVYKILDQKITHRICWLITWYKFLGNGVVFHSNFIARGVPNVDVHLKGKLVIGKQFKLHSGPHNVIGRQQPSYFIVGRNAELIIGDRVGLSSTALVCHNRIEIHDDVKLGGNVVVYDTDFHSLDAFERNSIPEIKHNIRTAPVIIKEGAFVGAHCTILKGVVIGRHAIVAAGSVVSRSIPDNEIWGGNPVRFIKKVGEASGKMAASA